MADEREVLADDPEPLLPEYFVQPLEVDGLLIDLVRQEEVL